MRKGRMIHPEILYDSITWYEANTWQRNLMIGMIIKADDDGLFIAEPKILSRSIHGDMNSKDKSDPIRYHSIEDTVGDISWLDHHAGFIKRYYVEKSLNPKIIPEGERGKYSIQMAHIVNWYEWQNIRKDLYHRTKFLIPSWHRTYGMSKKQAMEEIHGKDIYKSSKEKQDSKPEPAFEAMEDDQIVDEIQLHKFDGDKVDIKGLSYSLHSIYNMRFPTATMGADKRLMEIKNYLLAVPDNMVVQAARAFERACGNWHNRKETGASVWTVKTAAKKMMVEMVAATPPTEEQMKDAEL